jgi:hypothetical protein
MGCTISLFSAHPSRLAAGVSGRHARSATLASHMPREQAIHEQLPENPHAASFLT